MATLINLIKSYFMLNSQNIINVINKCNSKNEQMLQGDVYWSIIILLWFQCIS